MSKTDFPSPIQHPFQPVWDKACRILILGSFPSIQSREHRFYYGHPQNRFWKLIAALTNSDIPQTIEAKKDLLLQNHIALYDVIASCRTESSSDQELQDIVPVDLSAIWPQMRIQKVFANGAKAGKLYQQYLQEQTQQPIHILPSTSPANAAYSLERLIDCWTPIRQAFYKND